MKHLDIGSGLLTKNPYNAEEVYGIDILIRTTILIIVKSICLLIKFHLMIIFLIALSAYDFLEHIPRCKNKG